MAKQSDVVITINNLKKQFGDYQALNGLSLNVNKGEILALLGPNGAGKTTCLRTLYGLLKADEGLSLIHI